jgi:hypothetical protein
MAETFFKTLKSKLVWRSVILTRAEAAGAIGGYIDRASTTPSAATRRWTLSARPCSKDRSQGEPAALNEAKLVH